MSLYLHGEHSCGGDPGWIGIFDPSLLRKTALRQNELTIRFAKDAWSAADSVLDVEMLQLAQHLNTSGAGIIVFNPLQWSRSAVVSCTIPLSFKQKAFSC